MSLVRVPIANTIGKSVRFDPDATVGATIGTDLFLPDGSLPTLEDLFTAIVEAGADITGGGTTDQIFFEDISGIIADAQVPESAVTQHQAALTILETQITDGTILARVAGNESIVGDWIFSGLLTIPEATVTDHQAALSILETQIPNGTLLARVGDAETITGVWDFSAATMIIKLTQTGATADEGKWQIRAATDQFTIRAINDAEGAQNTWLTVDRTGITVDTIMLAATDINLSGAVTAISYGGILEANLLDKTSPETIVADYTFASLVPRIWFEETDAVANNQLWSIKAAFERFSMSVWTDNKVSENQFFQVERTGQTVDSIKLTATAIDAVGALTADSYGGILEANLLDKMANEIVSGNYTFNDGILVGDGQGVVHTSGPGFTITRLSLADDATGTVVVGTNHLTFVKTTFNADADLAAFFKDQQAPNFLNTLGGFASHGNSVNPDVDGDANYWKSSNSVLSIKNRLGSTRVFIIYNLTAS